MSWQREHVVERGRSYTDHVRGPHRIAQGYDTQAARAGEPWSLLERSRHVGTFASVADARRAADARGSR